jgi:hypothetical protein
MERTIISWNLPNWVTISLMAAATWAVLGGMNQLLKQGPTNLIGGLTGASGDGS